MAAHDDRHCGLALVAWEERRETWADLERLAGLVRARAPHIDVRVAGHRSGSQLGLLPLWLRPALSFSLTERRRRKLLPGRLLAGRRLGKVGEYERMDRSGIPVPRWTVIGPQTRLDPAEWGPYVVEKPSAGRLGAFVRIRKTGRVRYTPPEALPEDHYGRDGPMLAQSFVYTGEWPASYRVVTLLGEVLLCYRQVTRGRGATLAGRWDFGRVGGTSIVSNTQEMEIALNEEADVIALAERAHREAFADIPVLNFDIVRDAETGALFVLECHAHGGWMFSSRNGLGIQAASGIRFEAQFDAFAKAARVLAERTPQLAGWRCSPAAVPPG
ncbi:MAG: hypothetical protein IT486_13550 [Gammaproteobacteria bacterium]|nr:hypothetical protein [Gammaproteobacteria bacterium]